MLIPFFKKSVKNILFDFFKSYFFFSKRGAFDIFTLNDAVNMTGTYDVTLFLNFCKRDVFDIFTLNAVNMTGTYDVTLHNLMSFCHEP